MKTILVIAAFLVMFASDSTIYAQYGHQYPPPAGVVAPPPPAQTQVPPAVTMSPALGQMGAGQEGGMPDMMSMMNMMGSMMHPAIAVDGNAVYVVQGNRIFKLNKTTLKILAVATLPMPENIMKMGGIKEMKGMRGTPEAGMTGRGPSMTMRPEMEQTMEQMRQMQPSQFEQSFLQNMIQHHQGAIEMSQLALTRATHPELRQFAEKIISDQRREQQQFASWLKNWYQVSTVRQQTPMDTQMTAQLRNLSGRDFEIRYMQDMIIHHSEAVQMASDAEQKTLHPEVKDVALKIITEQSQEITQLKNWLMLWYGVDNTEN
ncbi:MAG: DUF305 domain-containing protein [Armatimonadota bacterium]